MQAWDAFIRNVKNIGREAWLRILKAACIKFETRTQPVPNINCIGCLVRQGYLASRGVILARVVLTTRSE